MFSQTEHTSQGLWHDFYCSTLKELTLFRETERFAPLSVPSCVRCAVEQRCWRISRNSYFAGREKRSHLRSAKGKCASSKTFHLPGSWVRALLSELGVSQGWGGQWSDGEKWWELTELWHPWDWKGGINVIITVPITQSKSNLNKILVKKNTTGYLSVWTLTQFHWLQVLLVYLTHLLCIFMHVRTCMYLNIFKHIFLNTTLLFG